MEKKRMNIYVSQELWKKFKELAVRDRMSMSGLVEDFIREWVHRKDPGNPQRPLTAYSPGHEDQEALLVRELVKLYSFLAINQGREIRYMSILEDLKAREIHASQRRTMAEAIVKDLKELGVSVVW